MKIVLITIFLTIHLFDVESVIFPGTKWCGNGNIAKFYDDLGPEKETDMCCREHDQCKEFMQFDESSHGLKNHDKIPKLNCECDAKFYLCLKKIENIKSANIVGKIYFNILNKQCFKEGYLQKKCLYYHQGRCIYYEFNRSVQKKYQWFDLPRF